MTVNDLIVRTQMTEVWVALGGGDPRRGRGRAFWRGGYGYNVSINADKGAWFDHVTGEGGGILDLILLVRDCSRQDALKWLADYYNLPLDNHQVTPEERQERAAQRERDLDDGRAAGYFSIAAAALAEESLEQMAAFDLRRKLLTDVMRTCQTESGLLSEFRAWRQAEPDLTTALVAAGMAAERRAQVNAAQVLMETAHVT